MTSEKKKHSPPKSATEVVVDSSRVHYEKKKLFNPEGSDALDQRKMIGGNSTNLFNLNNVKFPWANKSYRAMMENFWIPEKVSLTNDKVDYDKLTKSEQRAYNGILSFLVFLDSIQTNNLPNVADHITAPEVKLALAVQTFQEAVHSQSYAVIIETIIPKGDKDKVYDYWRKDNVLFKRNEYIAGIYQEFIDEPSDENFGKIMVADYLLEGLYFYNGFNFFYNLAARNLMIGTKDMIKYIHRDELTHAALFEKIIKTIRQDNKKIISDEMIIAMFNEAVKHEIEWGKHIIGDDVLGMSPAAIEQHTYWLANHRLKQFGIKPQFPEITENPFKHLNKIADLNSDGDSKGNFFEATVTSYNQSTVLSDWDDIDDIK